MDVGTHARLMIIMLEKANRRHQIPPSPEL